MKILVVSIALLLPVLSGAQSFSSPLSVESIMRDPKWIGSSPANPFWSNDGKKLYFYWNPDQAPADSLYMLSPTQPIPEKVSVAEKQALNTTGNFRYNQSRTAYVYSRQGDIYLTQVKNGYTKRITQTAETESEPQFGFLDTKIIYIRGQQIYAWDIAGGETIQLISFKSGESGSTTQQRGTTSMSGRSGISLQEKWLETDQLNLFTVLKERKEKRVAAIAYNKSLPKEEEMRSISLDDKSLQGLTVSPDGRYVSYRLMKAAAGSKSSIVPAYVTESGFTTDIPARTKVGAIQPVAEFYVYDRVNDSIIAMNTALIPGINDLPEYLSDYPKLKEEKARKPQRAVSFGSFTWSPKGSFAVLEVRSRDNKDRWLLKFDPAAGTFSLLDRQHDEAWIGGPGTSGFGNSNTGWIDDNHFWFRSEKTGYAHLYMATLPAGELRALTNGSFEVQTVQLSLDKKSFYITTNEVHPGEQHFYKLQIADGKKEKLTVKTGAHQSFLSPDEKWIASLYSYTNQPWELFLRENKPGAREIQLTHKAKSAAFAAYLWRDPEVITIPARDGAAVYARIYKPAVPHPSKPAVLFVHGAGYLQNAHKWWSSYYREYMFNNMLTDLGYYVLDIDYRGSAGYGRDWRTGIYRHMGGKDLTDHVDAVKWLVDKYGVNPAHVGLYGGSYGGFITLMGMFTAPETFSAGAALRPVTDWANYNHGYTSNILNEPFTDSLAYRRSSPIYHAAGLRGDLLICHGMVDVNVHFQDAVKLAQRLIELGKENWELAAYPMEDHGFVEPSSWTDEYKRILKLFESKLKK